MAPVSMALAATALLLALVGSVSAQDSTYCLSLGPYLLIDSCSNYLTVNTVTMPDTFCCSEVDYITTNYGTDCLCQIVLQGPIDPSLGEIPGRTASLATLCNSNADMSNCTTPTSAPAAATSPPPPSIFLRPPPPPEFEAPSDPTASGSKGTTASKAAIVGGSVAGGGVSIMGLLYLLVRYLPDCININIDFDLNKPCCCCHRRDNKPENTNGGPVPAAPHQAHPSVAPPPHQAYPHVPPPVQHWRPHLGTHHWV